MTGTRLLGLALLSATGSITATSGFLLGVDYSEWFDPNATQIAADSSGALYVLSGCTNSLFSPSCVTKLSADGTTTLWRNTLGFAVDTMAVDPNGGVYVVPTRLSGASPVFVSKLSAGGMGIVWKTPVGFDLPPGAPIVLAADSSGRAYVAGSDYQANSEAEVVRLHASGDAVDYTAYVTGVPTSLAVDGSGAAFVATYTFSQSGEAVGSLARLAPDGSAGFYSNMLPISAGAAVAVDPDGDAVIYAGNANEFGVLQRFDSTGAVTFLKTLPGEPGPNPALALDMAGNAYVMGSSQGKLYPVRNSLATCGSVWLSVFAPDGSLLQSTYVLGGGDQFAATGLLVATGPNSTVFVVGPADASFAATQAGPFPAGTSGAPFLLRLSPNANAQTYPLACVGNSATYDTGAIAPGEIVTLFGNGLGPEQGIQTHATLQRPFPTQAGNVAVTFDDRRAPLLWVQDGQINVVAPWSLTPGQTTQVCVSSNGVKTNCLTSLVAQTAPGVFTVDGVHPAALNQDGTLNSVDHPAPVGSIVTIFATGLGPITPPQADGTLVGLPLPNNVLAVVVEAISPSLFGADPGTTTPFHVTYAGPSPYLVAGASQIDFQIFKYPGEIYVNLPLTQSQAFLVYVAGQ